MALEFDLKPGLKGTAEVEVTTANTADTIASGVAQVFATPMMVGLMEAACSNAVQPHLPEGLSSVGILVNITHIAATPIGHIVKAEAELVAIEGRKLIFKVVAHDEVEKVGEGTHERFVIEMARFMNRVQQKVVRKEA